MQDHSLFTVPTEIAPFIVGFTMIVVCSITLFFPPKKIRRWRGYSTRSSRSSQEKWDFAQKYSAKVGIAIGIILTMVSPLFDFVKLNGILVEILPLAVIFGAFALLFFATESAIKKKFPTSSLL